MKRASVFILSIFILLEMLTACGAKSDMEQIVERVDTFLNAYNAGDLEKTIECFDPKTRNTYKSMLNVGNALVGMTGLDIAINDIFGLGVGLLSDGELLRLEDREITFVSDTEAILSARAYYEGYSGYTEDVSLRLVKEDGDWYFDK